MTKIREHLPFVVEQVTGGMLTNYRYGLEASQILELAYPEISTMKDGGAQRAVGDDFLSEDATIFLLLLEGSLVGFSSYSQIYVCSAESKERHYFGWTEQEWLNVQWSTATSGWTVIHPDFQHQGGWSQMMDHYDASLQTSNFVYSSRQVRKANNYAAKVEKRYHPNIIFQTDIFGYGPQVHFRIRIPRE